MKIMDQKYGDNPLSIEQINQLDRRIYYSISEETIRSLQKRNNELVDIGKNNLFMQKSEVK